MSRCATIIWFPLISDSTHFQYVFGKNQRYHHCQLLHISAKNIEKHVGRPTRLWKISKKKKRPCRFLSVCCTSWHLGIQQKSTQTVPCAAPSSNTPGGVSYQLWQIPIDSYIKWPHYKELQIGCINATLGNSNGPTHYHHPQVEHNHRGSLSPWHLASRPR